jgi:hypothetical protein
MWRGTGGGPRRAWENGALSIVRLHRAITKRGNEKVKLKRFAVITITAIVACTPPGSATRHVQEELVELTIKGEFQLLRQGGDASPSSGCSGIGSTIEIHFEDLDTAHPYIANSKIACDRLISYPNTWIIRCEQRVVGPTAPWYWIYYDTYLDRLRWDEKEYLGWSFLSVDIGEYLWCVYMFRITDALTD